jgi:mRNA-degrading endonuclease toxin of MazEF toxin-antitoxin module
MSRLAEGRCSSSRTIEGGLTVPSAAICEAIRSLSKKRLVTRWGVVGVETLAVIEDRLRILLRL